MVYQFRTGARVAGGDAQTAGDELARIQLRDGKIETATVVDEARPDEAPLHPVFEWDDAVAGEQYRLQQARLLVRAVEVAPEKKDEEPLPAFVHVRAVSTDEPGYYQSSFVAVRNPDEWASAVEELRSKAASLVKSVEVLERLAENKPRRTRALVKKVAAATSATKAAIDGIAE